ncbi:hypothetical protein CEXT_681681, partial [Caerostris extrusa]
NELIFFSIHETSVAKTDQSPTFSRAASTMRGYRDNGGPQRKAGDRISVRELIVETVVSNTEFRNIDSKRTSRQGRLLVVCQCHYEI